MSIICCGTKATRLPSYKLQQTPPWILSVLFALQHLVVQASLLCTCHFLLLQSRPLQLQDQSQLLASSLFTCGITTILQSSLGTRLPLVQAPTFELLIPALILSKQTVLNRTSNNETQRSLICTGSDCEQLQNGPHSVSEVSGALLVTGLLQLLFGATGLWGWILQHSGPMVIAPTLSIIGLSCFKQATFCCSSSWGIALLLIFITGLLSQNLHSCHIPIYSWELKRRTDRRYVPVLRMLSMLLPIACIWIVFIILKIVIKRKEVESAIRLVQNQSTLITANSSSSVTGFGVELEYIPWFQIPSLGGFGWPQFNFQTLTVGIAMTVTSSLSSLGCYILCSRVMSSPPVPSHACNRGISMEGVGNILSGVLGSICGVGSSITNAGMVGLTQVGSRHPVQISAVLFVILGSSPKMSEILMSIPLAVHGGVLCLTYSVAVGAGVSYFQYADIDSGRNIFIVGFAMFMALLIPRWLVAHPGHLVTGWEPFDLFLLSLLTVPVFMCGLLSFILDNTVTGTLRERGLDTNFTSCLPVLSKGITKGQQDELAEAYGLPCGLSSFFPTVYPCNQLCPPQLEIVTIIEGEEDKLLSKPVTDS
ncbi:solute carrier family 23 member 3 [Bombina bombina]|uniref:solute carrier family 23 member 3 n=1 Tax=Bombina bombina TaxID=8345 RepID=UPI00235B0CBC|nr:solute carrier family 23 member 3 [Bombina bombina]